MDDCQHAGQGDFQDRRRLQIDENEYEWEACAPFEIRRGKTPLSHLELCGHRRGVVEMAFDHENGGIVVEVIAAKICCGVIDIDHEVLGGQRRTASHYGGKALYPKFFTKPTSPAVRSAEASSQISSGDSPMGGQDESMRVSVPVFARNRSAGLWPQFT